MPSEYVCKKSNRILKGKKCATCGTTDVTDNWKGRVVIFDPDKSEIAKKMDITMSGKYALKVK
jgi:DNA-directed RNA polymerase subunit E"